MSDVAKRLTAAAEDLLKIAHALEPAKPLEFFGTTIVPGEGWRAMLAQWEDERIANLAKPAPFGRTPDGKPRIAPAYDGCRALWEAAQRDGVFNIHAFIGQGIQQGAAQMYNPVEPDQLALEEAILAIGKTDWGKGWLAADENLALIERSYAKRLTGAYVVRHWDGQYERRAA